MVSVRQNVEAITLAEAIYAARARYYGVNAPAWAVLDPRAKQEYVEHASDILYAVKPAPNSRGRGYFEFAADLARRAAVSGHPERVDP